MFYISSKKGDKYGITDTSDGVEEFYTESRIVDMVLQGLRVDGCSYSSNEDLRKTGHFWSIEVRQHKRVGIKVNKYYNIKAKKMKLGYDSDKEYQFQGYCLSIDYSSKDVITFITLDAKSINILNNSIISYSEISINNEYIKSIMKEYKSLSELLVAKKSQLKNLEQEVRDISKKLNSLPSKLLAYDGQITLDEFKKLVIDNLNPCLKDSLTASGYKMTTPDCVFYSDNSIYFTFRKMLGHAKDCKFARQRYDSSFELTDTSSDAYNRCLSAIRLNNKINTSLPFKDDLIIIDYTVYYQAYYEIVLPNKPLTRDLALSFAKGIK